MKKRKRLEAKYIFRRILLALIFLGLAGGALWFAYNRTVAVKTAETAQRTDAMGRVLDSEPESMPAPVSNPEPESAPESQPSPMETRQEQPDGWELLLVNYANPLPEDYSPELEIITENFKVDKRIADNVKRMFAKAREDGISLMICSAYRSLELQQTNFENKKQELMADGRTEDEAIAVTASIIAVPGTSEHHTGLAMDIVTPSYQTLDSGFENTPAFRWLDANAYKYGFILRFPEDKYDITKIIYEPWHYRYVGEENAAKIKASGLCLEEYVELIKSGQEIPLEAATSALEGEGPASGSPDGGASSSEGTESAEDPESTIE